MIPKTHPRKASLELRHILVEGFKKGLVAQAGLIAHGRGEAFDYLLGEKTIPEARKAEEAAVAMLFLAKNPVISVNGNVAALCPKEIVKLAEAVDAKIEVNLFYRKVDREKKIAAELKKAGVEKMYGVGSKPKRVKGLSSHRALIDEALWNSDVVLVPLEDGDRTEALVNMGKKVIAIDLNPMSRTSKKATITIVDNVVRAIPNMTKNARRIEGKRNTELMESFRNFRNKDNLAKVVKRVRGKI
ncbi:MAG: 4-phosphopantoate--beta-alanine ligase [Candidatus Altiarchaeota archaeon]